MAGKKGRNASVLLNEYDISRYLKKAAPSVGVEMLDGTTFQPPGGGKEKVPGTSDGKISAEGFFQAKDGTDGDAASLIDDILHAIRGAEDASVLTVSPENADAVGRRALLMLVHESNHAVETPVDNLIMTQAEFESTEGLDHGVVLHPVTAETATGNGSSVDNAASTSNGAVAHLHVTAASDDGDETLDVIVQHSVDNSVWVDLITFTQVGAVGSERLSAAGTVNRYLRARRVVGGGGSPSFTFAVAAARLY